MVLQPLKSHNTSFLFARLQGDMQVPSEVLCRFLQRSKCCHFCPQLSSAYQTIRCVDALIDKYKPILQRVSYMILFCPPSQEIPSLLASVFEIRDSIS